jgi:hypothetical protein
MLLQSVILNHVPDTDPGSFQNLIFLQSLLIYTKRGRKPIQTGQGAYALLDFLALAVSFFIDSMVDAPDTAAASDGSPGISFLFPPSAPSFAGVARSFAWGGIPGPLA